MSTCRNFIFLGLLIIAVLAVAAASAVVSGFDRPIRRADPAVERLTTRPLRPAPDQEREGLIAKLEDARRSGETSRAQDLQSQLDARDGLLPGLEMSDTARVNSTVVELLSGLSGGGDKWQGNDVKVAGTADSEGAPDIVCDKNGVLYTAYEIDGQGTSALNSIYINRSIDGGETWSWWLSVYGPENHSAAALTMCEGTESWLFMAFVNGMDEVDVLRVDPDNAANYSLSVVEANPLGVGTPSITTDCSQFSSGWYAYVTWNSNGIDNWVLNFARTVDYGASWQTPWTIHAYCGYPDIHYDGFIGHPDICFGYGTLHIAFDDKSSCTDSNRAVFATRSVDYGNTWAAPLALTDDVDDDYDPSIAAARFDEPSTVLVAYTSDVAYESDTDVDYAYSLDDGIGWSTGHYLSAYSNMWEYDVDVAASDSAGAFHAAFIMNWYAVYYATAPFDDPEALSWSGHSINYFREDFSVIPWKPAVTANPTLPVADEAAIVWYDSRNELASGWDVFFDSPTTEGLGTISIQADPDDAGAQWNLSTWPSGVDLNGSGDNVLQNMEEGDYTLTWFDTGDWTPTCATPVTGNLAEGATLEFSCEYDYIPPLILSVTDVSNDQGRQVRLIWERSAYDAPGLGDDITGYDIYRRQDGAKTGSPADKMAGWDWLASQPAHGDDIYQFVAPSLCDSTDAGICWSVFMVRATSADPFVFHDSAPDSGYSVDNLAPSAPSKLVLVGGILSWDDPIDADFDYFTVYGSPTPDLTDATLLGYTEDTSLDVLGANYAYLLVTATDFAGNEGEAAVTVGASGVVETPSRFRLLGAVPNPFNPRTEIRYELPEDREVDLQIYDSAGRLVRSLLRGQRVSAGPRSAVWDGRDGEGCQVSAGVFFYRIIAGPDKAGGRMVLVK